MTDAILITGASRGIGASIVRKLADENNCLAFALIARESESFEQFVAEMRQAHPDKQFIPLHADVGKDEQLVEAMEKLHGMNINVKTVINNAGYTNPRSINEIAVDDFVYTLKANLVGPFVIVQDLIRRGKPPKVIVNVASTAGINGRPGWLTYSASKAGLINMTEVMRQELKVYGTRVVCISPGRCATDLRRILAPDEDPSTIMQPSDVAGIVSILLSDVGHLIDSQNLVIRQ